MDKQKKKAIKKLKKDIESKVRVEREAFSKVMELIDEESISEEKLIATTPWLNPVNYSDIVEERFSMKLCGYILCPNKLINIPKHKYHISVATRQVFDLSERKKFCSNQCFKESEYFAGQLSKEPIWERNISDVPTIQFLTKTDRKVDVGKNRSHDDSVSVEDIEKRAVRISEKESGTINVGIEHSTENKSEDISGIIELPPSADNLNISHPSIPPLQECCKVVSTWLTNRTLNFLIKSVDSRDFFDGIPVFPTLTEQLKEKLANRLSDQPSDSDDFSSDDTLSDNDELATGKYVSKSTLDKMQSIFVKHVKSPMSPKGKLPALGSLDTEHIGDIQESEGMSKPDFVLPMVDSVSQTQMRCNIVLAKLSSVTCVVTQSLQLIAGDFWQDITELVKTFRLTQYNISFNKSQWEFILIMLTYLISLINAKVKSCIDDEQKHTELITPLIEHWEDPTLLKEVALLYS